MSAESTLVLELSRGVPLSSRFSIKLYKTSAPVNQKGAAVKPRKIPPSVALTQPYGRLLDWVVTNERKSALIVTPATQAIEAAPTGDGCAEAIQ